MAKETKKILVADKDITLVEFLQERIRDGRFQFILATNGDRVAELVENTKFFAAIVDFESRDKQGLKIIDRILDNEIPTIATIHHLTPTIHAQLLRYPIIDYVIRENVAGKSYLSDLIQGLEYFFHKQVMICFDGNFDAKENLKQIFHSLLFSPIIIDTAKEALWLLHNDPKIRIIYIDNKLKDSDGIKLCREIKSTFPKREFVIFGGAEELGESSSHYKTVKGEFLKSGIVDFLSKPIDKERFNTHILSMMKILKHKQRLDTYVHTIDKYVLVSITTTGGVIVYASDAFCEICGYSKEELVGNSHSIIRHPDMPASTYQNMWSTIKSGNVWQGEIKNKKKDGSFYWVYSTVEPIYDDFGIIMGYQSVRFDITDKKYIEEISSTDKLTGLYNRRKFDEIVEYEMKQFARYHKDISVLIVDIDHFKLINDTYGHQMGDSVLVQISHLLLECLRKTDTLFRWGGEEFIILAPHTTITQGEILANKIRKAVEERKFEVIGHKTISVGLTVIQTEESIEKAIARADRALYLAKANGRNRVEVELSHIGENS